MSRKPAKKQNVPEVPGGRSSPDQADLSTPRYSRSLARGLAVLAAFNGHRSELGISDIADELTMSRSTAHRYVVTLLELRYLEQDAKRKYRLGARVTDLGMSVLNSTGLREQAHACLEELREQSSCTVSLAILHGAEILYVDRVNSFGRARTHTDLDLRPGSRLPAYCTAMGKVLLANLPDTEQHRLLTSMKLTKRAPNTITNKTALRRELEQIRDEGLAVNDQELAPEMHSIAAPVRDDAREVLAAINMVAATSVISLQELADTFGPRLISTAARISARLGGRAGTR
jgi:IclR family transcriptional regulator, pca regulon regulatory protein